MRACACAKGALTACKRGAEARYQHRDQADERIRGRIRALLEQSAVMVISIEQLRRELCRSTLHAEDAEREQHERGPLAHLEPLAEHADGEERGREDLSLVGDLRDRSLEVGEPDKQCIILHRIQQRRQRELHPLAEITSAVLCDAHDGRARPAALDRVK